MDEVNRSLDNINLFQALPQIDTQRLVLRPFSLEDAADVYEYASDPQVPRYLPWEAHRSVADSTSFLETAVKAYRDGRPFAWAMVLKETGKVIGGAGYNSWDRHHRSASFGYAMSRHLWGKGLMSEAADAFISFGFEQMELNRIWAIAEPENVGSWRVMEKCGLSFEGTLRDFRFERGRFRSFKLYSILRREWEMHPRDVISVGN